MEKMRCFVGINFPDNVVNEIRRVQGELDKKKGWRGKFVEGRNLHLTLKFLGEISQEGVAIVKNKLKRIEQQKFKAELGELGVFSPNFIRIVWIKIFGEGIFDLQKEVDGVLEGMFKPEERFMSHLTIARVKNVENRKLFLEELKKIKVERIGFDVKEFLLVKSTLKSEGPDYEVLGRYRLDL